MSVINHLTIGKKADSSVVADCNPLASPYPSYREGSTWWTGGKGPMAVILRLQKKIKILIFRWWNPKPYTPDSIVFIPDLLVSHSAWLKFQIFKKNKTKSSQRLRISSLRTTLLTNSWNKLIWNGNRWTYLSPTGSLGLNMRWNDLLGWIHLRRTNSWYSQTRVRDRESVESCVWRRDGEMTESLW